PKEDANVRVLGGDRLYQPHKYVDNDYSHLSFTAFAYPDEWDILPHQSPPPDFFCDYAIDFGGASLPRCPIYTDTKKSGYGYNRQDSNTILAYDALKIVLAEVTSAPGTVLPRDQLLQDIQNVHAFPGVSGQITFGLDRNPINKAILVLRVNENGFTRQE